ncbi:hypothetical protein K469DRAFT_754073 [Zopfia rhizophila CBS 207.26]|uniref:Uncharacterized protein n=1 Tax=Zopfia rhizophila CBS 207.26 TaxID=1314779 RepID=A0A6A6DHN0_9PEZI|nr:hypothetical protein K469DRAFT_754073 [Zopfia rhizophila CBS 207.26]
MTPSMSSKFRGGQGAMAAKGGLLFSHLPSIFTCAKPYMIKIYVGRINAISGGPAMDTAATKLHRLKKLAALQAGDGRAKTSLQDYVVVPAQDWLDEFANSDGTMRQFVTMPFGSGYSVESQVSGMEATGGLQFEVTLFFIPIKYTDAPSMFFVKNTAGKSITIDTAANDTICAVKMSIYDKGSYYRGAVAAYLYWEAAFCFTGLESPTTPANAAQYKLQCQPFLAMYEEPRGICGDLSLVKSVAELNGVKEEEVHPSVVDISKKEKNCTPCFSSTGIANPDGPLQKFRTISDLEKEFNNYHIADF